MPSHKVSTTVDFYTVRTAVGSYELCTFTTNHPFLDVITKRKIKWWGSWKEKKNFFYVPFQDWCGLCLHSALLYYTFLGLFSKSYTSFTLTRSLYINMHTLFLRKSSRIHSRFLLWRCMHRQVHCLGQPGECQRALSF